MRCVQNKWGAGSCSERTTDSVGANAMKKSLDAMLAERAQQDQKWSNSASVALATTYTSAEQTRQSQDPSSSERGRYAASSR